MAAILPIWNPEETTMSDQEKIGAIFDELNRKPERREGSGWSGEVIVAAILICLTLIFWPDLRLFVIHLAQHLRGG